MAMTSGNSSRRYTFSKDKKPSSEDKKNVSCDICDRPSGTVQCHDCKFILKGRVKMACASHPRVFHYTDLQKCPKCKGSNIKDVTKVDIYSPAKREVTETDGTCICFRRGEVVYCSDCGWYDSGRKRQSCPAHPKNLFLYDLLMCPVCKGANLEEASDI